MLQGLPKVSLTEWLAERGHTIIEEIGQSGIDYLLEAFDLKDVVLSSKCEVEQFPYSPTVDGWNIGKIYSDLLILEKQFSRIYGDVLSVSYKLKTCIFTLKIKSCV